MQVNKLHKAIEHAKQVKKDNKFGSKAYREACQVIVLAEAELLRGQAS